MTKTLSEFEQCAVMFEIAGQEMLARLGWMTFSPQEMVYLGAEVLSVKSALQAKYPDAVLHSYDAVASIPLSDHSVDLIFANLYAPYVNDQNAFIKEARRVLKKEGLLILTAFGIDTLKEIRALKPDLATPRILDLHDLGDDLARNQFADPVMEVDHWTLNYASQEKLKHELVVASMCLQDELIALTLPEDCLDVTYEIVFGHAFAPGEQKTFQANREGVVAVPVSRLQRTLT